MGIMKDYNTTATKVSINDGISGFLTLSALIIGLLISAFIAYIICFNTVIYKSLWMNTTSIISIFGLINGIILLILFSYFSKKIIPKFNYKLVIIVCVILIALTGSLYNVFVHANIPNINDSYELMNIAATLHKNGIISMNADTYLPHGNRLQTYLMHMPYQSGMILYDWLIMSITGVSMNLLPFQLINSIIIMPVSALLFTLISGELAHILKPNNDTNEQNVMKTTMILLTIFTPFSLYAWKIYGNIISMPFTLFSILLIIRLLRAHDDNSNVSIKVKTIRIILLCFSVFMMAWLKPNTSIMLIALMITLIISIIGKPELFKLIMLILLPLSFTAGYNTPIMIMQNYTDFSLNNNRQPPSSWIAMGTQYDARNQDAPGTYVRDYLDNTWYQHDINLIKKKMDKKIYDNIDFLIKNNSIFEFLYYKNVYAWSESSFDTYTAPFIHEKIWNHSTNEYRLYDKRFNNESNKVILNDVQEFFKNNTLTYYYIIDPIQTMIILAALTGIMLIMRKNKNTVKLTSRYNVNNRILIILPLIIITGGFLFHCFWETQPEYAFTYFLFFILYASIGLNMIKTPVLRKHNRN